MFVISTLALPLSNVAFAWPVLMNPPEVITAWTVGGLCSIVLGMALYNHKNAAPETLETSLPAGPLSLQAETQR